MKRVEGKVAVIAGGTGGIGTATSRRLAQEGAAVVIGDPDLAAAERVASDIRDGGGRAFGCFVDLADPASIARMFADAVAQFGGVDVLHCNGAAIGEVPEDSDAVAVDLMRWERTLAVNLTGYLHCTRVAVPLLLARGGGAIIYTSSGAGTAGEDTRVAYGVSKAGVNALMRHVARRWGKEGITANAIAPGLVRTPATDHLPQQFMQAFLARTPHVRLGVSEDIAAMVAMLASPDGAWINGQVINVDGGVTMS